MNRPINIFPAMAAMIRGFFEAFTRGIIDAENRDYDISNPRDVSQAIMGYTDRLADNFASVLFSAIARLTYSDTAELQLSLRQMFPDGKATDVKALMHLCCRYDDVYEAMTAEYRRNFTLLIGGHIASAEEHLEEYTRGSRPACIDQPTALAILTRTVVLSYAHGVHACPTGRQSLQHDSIYPMVFEMANILLNERPLPKRLQSVNELTKAACGTQANINNVLNTMEDTMRQLAKG